MQVEIIAALIGAVVGTIPAMGLVVFYAGGQREIIRELKASRDDHEDRIRKLEFAERECARA